MRVSVDRRPDPPRTDRQDDTLQLGGATMRKILIIDDDERIATTVQLCLETHAGYQVLIAPDGKAGIRAAAKAHPDLILLDIDMPKMSGLDVIRHLETEANTRYIPVIILTGDSTPEAKDEANYD